MSSKCKIHRLTFRKEAFVNQALVPAMTQAVKAGARAFVLAEASRIPVWTGMAIASLAAAVAEVGGGFAVGAGIPADVDPQWAAARREAGAGMGSAELNIGSTGVYFTWQSSVPHFIENESTSGPSAPYLANPVPWKSIPPSVAEGQAEAAQAIGKFDIAAAARRFIGVRK